MNPIPPLAVSSNLPIREDTDPDLPDVIVAELIHVRGCVQGVGFRPAVYRLAQSLHLRGDVSNDGQGVQIRLGGLQNYINIFVQQLLSAPPPLAKIDTLERRQISLEDIPAVDFQIVASRSSPSRTEISPDAATCPECHREIFNPASRRYRYPFTNCTHCGPRLSIVQGIPYDRALTSMASFPLCPDCSQEYRNVEDRRFHAQPIACHVCGPKVWLERSDGQPIQASMLAGLDELDTVCTLLQQGKIVAIKGLGGFHLACDATQPAAVEKLRQRKYRYHKPFALMARDLEMIQTHCQVSDHEQMLLTSPVAPIVLLLKRHSRAPGTQAIAEAVAPEQTHLGFMLPYSPLHHLILARMDRPIVLTSGNLSDQPQCIENGEARQKLAGVADYFLFHNRDIVNRIDDSVVRMVDAQVQILRRARGYAPAPIRLPAGFQSAPVLLAMGSELKNTFCLVRDGQAILSQHLGDLADAPALAAYQQTLQLYRQLYQHQPTIIAIDLHPEYLSSKLGQALAIAEGLAIEPIQHHHAHIAACMAENALPLATQPVLGIAWDGLGYGEDGQLWGGEFLLADYRQFHRLGHLKPLAMLGGEQAIHQPWRNTYAHLQAAGYGFVDATAPPLACELLDYLQDKPHPLLQQMLSQGLNSPLASSGGRLFDAVAAAVGLCRETCSYEGQGAIALETIATEYLQTQSFATLSPEFAYPFTLTLSPEGLPQLEPAPMWAALLADLAHSVPPAAIAARFHLGLAAGICDMASQLHQSYDFSEVVLSGGVWQNQLLLRQVSEGLKQSGFKVFSHHQVPTNDGGLSLGQAVIAAARALYPLP